MAQQPHNGCVRPRLVLSFHSTNSSVGILALGLSSRSQYGCRCSRPHVFTQSRKDSKEGLSPQCSFFSQQPQKILADFLHLNDRSLVTCPFLDSHWQGGTGWPRLAQTKHNLSPTSGRGRVWFYPARCVNDVHFY